MTMAHLQSSDQRAGLRRVISGKHFEFAPEGRPLQNIEERLDCGKPCRLLSEDEVVTLAVQGREVQTERLSSGPCGEADVGIAGYDTVCCG
jgi:hypothetical protein